MKFRVLPMGDAAFTIEFPDEGGPSGARLTTGLCHLLDEARNQGKLDGVIDLISASRSFTVCLDPLTADYRSLQDQVTGIITSAEIAATDTSRLWQLPACYDPEFGLDLAESAERADLTIDALIATHSAEIYDVLMIGFLPGFPFMTQLPEKLRFPRRASPRTRVPARTVAMAINQTAIYPWESPGGWHLLARCPIPLFDPTQPTPALLSPGDRVKFRPIEPAELEEIEAKLTAGTFEFDSLLTPEETEQ